MTTEQPGSERSPSASQGPDLPSDEQLRRAVHDLRNAMNSLLLNVGVLQAQIASVPEPMRPFVENIARGGRRCSDELTQLFELVQQVRKRMDG